MKVLPEGKEGIRGKSGRLYFFPCRDLVRSVDKY